MLAIAKISIPVFNSYSNSRVFNSNAIFNSTNFNSNSNSRIRIELQFQFRNYIDPNPVCFNVTSRQVNFWVGSGCPPSGVGGQGDCSSSYSIHDADIRHEATKIADRSWDLRIFSRTRRSILIGGKAYTVPIPDQGIGIASTYFALGSGNGDVKTGSFLLAKVTNKSITAISHEDNTGWRSCLLMAHSVGRVWPTTERQPVAWSWEVNWH